MLNSLHALRETDKIDCINLVVLEAEMLWNNKKCSHHCSNFLKYLTGILLTAVTNCKSFSITKPKQIIQINIFLFFFLYEIANLMLGMIINEWFCCLHKTKPTKMSQLLLLLSIICLFPASWDFVDEKMSLIFHNFMVPVHLAQDKK